MSALDPEFNSPTVPAFLTKLRLLVDDTETNDLIYWDRDGASFHICDGNRLAKEILPLFFKHNNLSSFIRQLNMYGFRKVNRVDPAAAFKTELEDMEFKHPYFLRDKPHMMGRIQRKPHANVSGGLLFNGRAANSPMSSYFGSAIGQSMAGLHHSHRPELERLYTMIRALRANQDTMTNQLTILQSENQLLYRELSELRDRHEQQSQLIQTLFTFLSAFAKDGQSSKFRFGPNKRRALPFSPSNIFASSTHSGLKLNLPQGFDLDDYTKAVHPLQLTTSDEALPSPYKIAKMDFRALPTNVPEITHRLSPNTLEALGQSPHTKSAASQLQPMAAGTSQQQQQHQLLHAVPALSQPAAYRMRTKSGRAHPDAKRMINFPKRIGEQNSTAFVKSPGPEDALAMPHGRTSSTVRTKATEADSGASVSSHPIVFSSDEQDSYCLRPDVKPVISQEDDLTMTSLTHESATTAAAVTSPLVTVVEAGGNTLSAVGADGGDSQLVDLNLSRCTTPVSLIQPDSVDLTEFLAAARAVDESEISMDDLFLASAALESPNAKGDLQCAGREKPNGTVATDLSFGSNQSEDGDAAISLPDVCAEEVVSSGTGGVGGGKDPHQNIDPIDPSDLDEITLDPISDCASTATTETESIDRRVTSSSTKRRCSSLTTPAHHQLVPEPNDRELFGLPWEDGLMGSAEEADSQGDEDPGKSLNAGLLPAGDISPNSRLKLMAKNSLESIKNQALQVKNNSHDSFIVGNEIIPVEAAAPFANVSMGNLVQILQPTLVPVSAVRQSPLSTSPAISQTDAIGTVSVAGCAALTAPVQAHVSHASSLSATSSPPLMRSRFQPRPPVATLIPHSGVSTSNGGVASTNVIGATGGGSVSSTQCVIPVLPLTTVALGQPVLAAASRPLTWTLPVNTTALARPVQRAPSVATQPARSIPARTPTVYKRIAPAPRPIARSSPAATGAGTAPQPTGAAKPAVESSSVKH